MSHTAIYPGTFDPITLGHINIIERASSLFDKVIISVSISTSKAPAFSIAERVKMVKDAISHLPNVTVLPFEGLLVEFAKKHSADVILRGLRNASDFEYEVQLAGMNHAMHSELETCFLITNPKYSHISSSLVRQIARLKGDVSAFVPENVVNKF